LPSGIVVENTLRKIIPDGFNAPANVYSEYLDVEWLATQPPYAAQEAELLNNKYRERNVRVVVASGNYALQFVTNFRDRMLAGLPVVHLLVDKDSLEQITLPGYVGKPIDLDPTPTLHLALRLHPDAKRLVIVLGGNSAPRDRLWERLTRLAVSRLEAGLDVEFLTGLPIPEIRRRLGALPRGTIVFTVGYSPDPEGVSPRHSVERMAETSVVPIYSQFDSYLGTGVVGGYVTPFEQLASDAGATAVQLLKGATPSSQIASGPLKQVPMVDWRQIRRWGIDEKLLPPDTIAKFREPSAWGRYGLEISILAAILLLQAGLIIALLIERRSRRRTAAALGESHQQMSLAAGLSAWTWDTSENENGSTSRRRQRANGEKAKSIRFEKVLDSVHPADRENLRRAAWRALRTGDDLDVEYRVVLADGAVRWVAARGRPEGGDSRRLFGIALDVTERKTAELRAAEDRNALRHMSRVSMMGQLSAAIAHQLYQPLAAILGNAETAQKMLRRNELDVVELEDICKDIVSEDRRATEVIRRLSDLYKRDRLETKPIDINQLVAETLDLLRTELIVRHVDPRKEFAASLRAVDGDPVQLQQVVLNLVLNAADAMAEANGDRRVTVRTEARRNDVRFCVIDNGPGIAENKLDSVFDPFWTTKSAGMGMGLAVCRAIVAAHRGTITASNNPEGGATFCVNLPACE